MKTFFSWIKALCPYFTNGLCIAQKTLAPFTKSVKLLVVVMVVGMVWGKEVWATNYYSAGNTDAKTLTSWWTNTDGSGTHPTDFATLGNFFIIQNGHSMSTSAAWAVTGSGSTIQINTGGTLVATFGVTATVMAVAGTYQHNFNGGTIPAATWEVGSFCKVTGVTATMPAGLQSFYNFTWECSSQSGGVGINSSSFGIQSGGVFSVKNTGSSILSFSRLPSLSLSDTWAGDFTIDGGSFYLLNTPSSSSQDASLTVNNLTILSGLLGLNYDVNHWASDATLTVNGDFVMSGGTLDMIPTTGATSSSTVATLNINGNYTWSGGQLQRTNLDIPVATIDFVKTSGIQEYTQSGGTTYGASTIGWSHSGAGSINNTYLSGSMNAFGYLGPTRINNFTVNSTGTITLFNNATISGTFYMTKGTFALGGKTLNWGASSALEYNGTAAQTTGPEWQTSFTKPVTVSNTGGVVTLGTAVFTGTSATTTINTGATLATGAGTFTNAGALAINGSFQINQSGWATNAVTGSPSWTFTNGTLIFNNTLGSFGVNSGDVFWPTTNGPTNVNVKGAGGITMNAARTVSGIFQTSAAITNVSNLTFSGIAKLNTGGGFSTASSYPTYNSSSTLVYNTGSAFTRSNEWPNVTSGAGYPANVQISNPGTNTTLNMGSTAAKCAGNITVDASAILNTTSSGLTVVGGVTVNGTISLGADVYVGGDWTIGSSGTQTNNTKAVFFNAATGNQTITKTDAGTVYFDYLVIDKATSGNVVISSSPATDVSISGTSGSVLDLRNTGGLDLNGRSLNLTGNGGSILVTGAARTISATGSGNFNIQGTKTVTSASSGSLVFASTVTVKSSGTNVNFGSSLTTINGTLELLGGSVAAGGAPIYSTSSLLKYNTGTNYAAYEEWYANNSGFGAGVPQNVTITAGSSLNFGSSTTYRLLRGDLNFSTPLTSTSTLALSNTTGGDLYIGGNWNKASGGVFAPNGRLVKFNSSGNGQTITSSGGETFAHLEVNNSYGVTLANDITVNNTLTLTSGLITTGSNTITIGSSGSISGASTSRYIDGKLAHVITSQTATIFPVGKGGNYRPVTFTYTAAPTSKTVTIEQFESGSPLSLASVSTALFGGRYWNIAQSATGISYTVGLNNSGFTPTGTAIMLRREGTGTATSNATSFSTPTYTNSISFSTGNVSNDVQLGENSIPLTITSAAATSKIYDKTNTAAITGTLSGVVSPDVVTLTGTGTFASVNVANGIGVTSTSTLAGANAGAYSLTQPTGLTANITARPLTITGAANTKTFDGNNSSATNPTVTSGVVQSGDVAAFTQVYDNANVGTSKVMTPSGIVTDGNSGNNYSYSFVTSSNGTINQATSTQWNGSASSNWNTPANWTPPVSPTTGISAEIVSAGTAPIITSTGNETANLTITSGSLTIATTGNLTVNGMLSNTNNAGLVIKSDGTGTGSLITSSSSSPAATVERYLTNYSSGTDKMFHFISSPVAAQAIQTEFVTTPITAGHDFYKFDEATNTWINSKANGGLWNVDFESTFTVGKGYMVAYPTATVPKSFTGNLNAGDFTPALTYTSDKGKGWNLIGNPYSSAIDWTTVTRGNGVDDALYYYNAAAQNYQYYIKVADDNITVGGGSRYIPAMQGFMVHAASTGTRTLTIHNTDRVHEAQTTYYKSGNTVPGSLSLTVSANGYQDEALMYFNANATNNFDGQYDAYKLRSYSEMVPAIYTIAADGSELAINGMPELSENSTIPVSFVAGKDGEYTLTANLQNLPNAHVYLVDNKLSKTQNLSDNPAYTFTSTTTDQSNRFKLTFGSVGIPETDATEPLRIYLDGSNLNIIGASMANAEIRITNMLGQVVLRGKTNGNTLTTLNANNLKNGVYMVSLIGGGKVASGKFVK